MKVVIDANIFISFLLTGGETISSIIDFWEEKEFVLPITEEIIGEIEENAKRLIKDGRVEEEEVRELLWRLENDTESVVVYSRVSASPDKKDNRYLACAKDGKADFLVTGDKKHLLPLKKFGKTRIISPVEFKALLV